MHALARATCQEHRTPVLNRDITVLICLDVSNHPISLCTHGTRLLTDQATLAQHKIKYRAIVLVHAPVVCAHTRAPVKEHCILWRLFTNWTIHFALAHTTRCACTNTVQTRGTLYTGSELPDVSTRQAILNYLYACTHRHILHAVHAQMPVIREGQCTQVPNQPA